MLRDDIKQTWRLSTITSAWIKLLWNDYRYKLVAAAWCISILIVLESLLHIWNSIRPKWHFYSLESIWKKKIFNVLEFCTGLPSYRDQIRSALSSFRYSSNLQEKEQRFRSPGCQIGARSGEWIRDISWCAGGMIKTSLQGRDCGWLWCECVCVKVGWITLNMYKDYSHLSILNWSL